jgi:hypothetical protein
MLRLTVVPILEIQSKLLNHTAYVQKIIGHTLLIGLIKSQARLHIMMLDKEN